MMRWYWILLICVVSLGILSGLAVAALYIGDLVRDHAFVGYVRQIQGEMVAWSAPVRVPSTRGIAMVAGGPRYGPLAERLIRQLDQLGSQLPIEIWALDAQELQDPSMIRLGKHPRVTLHNLDDLHPPPVTSKRVNGYRSKSLVLVHTGFDQVLLLDADNLPLSNPDDLFDLPEFQEHGAVFWPDSTHFDSLTRYQFGGWFPFTAKTGVRHPRIASMRSLFQKLSLGEARSRRQYESGQLLIDCTRHPKALYMTMKLNEKPDITYQSLLGDKDTYSICFDLCNESYYSVPHSVGIWGTHVSRRFRGLAFIQHHPSTAQPLFAHFVGLSQKTEGLEYECTHIMYPDSKAKMRETIHMKTLTATNHCWSKVTWKEYRYSRGTTSDISAK